jgi:hypothetical protein
LGLIASKTPELEDKDAIITMIHEPAKFVPLERLCLSAQWIRIHSSTFTFAALFNQRKSDKGRRSKGEGQVDYGGLYLKFVLTIRLPKVVWPEDV